MYLDITKYLERRLCSITTKQFTIYILLKICWCIDFTVIIETIIPNISSRSLNLEGKATRYSITFAKSFLNVPVTSLRGLF